MSRYADKERSVTLPIVTTVIGVLTTIMGVLKLTFTACLAPLARSFEARAKL